MNLTQPICYLEGSKYLIIILIAINLALFLWFMYSRIKLNKYPILSSIGMSLLMLFLFWIVAGFGFLPFYLINKLCSN